MESVYFIGIGGIGMAALARYFMKRGAKVAGYDRTPSALTKALENEGAEIIYTDDASLVKEEYLSPSAMCVYTPAVPQDSAILTLFREHGPQPIKRAAVLGHITRRTRSICVSGSHGKTTTSSMIAHTLYPTPASCDAFLGGILREYNSNLLLAPQGSEWSVTEADEYDRSFHQLRPEIAVVTSTDPDHLDIYGDEDGYLEGFAHFTSLIRKGGKLILHTGLKLHPRTADDVQTLSYSSTDSSADFYASDIKITDGHLTFSLHTPTQVWKNVELSIPIEINVDNAVACAAACLQAGATEQEIRRGLATFPGPKRRFELWLRDEDYPTGQGPILIDDYAHSPGEVEASLRSVRRAWPARRVIAIFQPHLYTRTRDFAPEFAAALEHADTVLLPEIYPARELPIPGVSSEIIARRMSAGKARVIKRSDLIAELQKELTSTPTIVMTIGAADLDRLLPLIADTLRTCSTKNKSLCR